MMLPIRCIRISQLMMKKVHPPQPPSEDPTGAGSGGSAGSGGMREGGQAIARALVRALVTKQFVAWDELEQAQRAGVVSGLGSCRALSLRSDGGGAGDDWGRARGDACEEEGVGECVEAGGVLVSVRIGGWRLETKEGGGEEEEEEEAGGRRDVQVRLVCAVTVAAGEEKGVGGSEPASARASVRACARALEPRVPSALVGYRTLIFFDCWWALFGNRAAEMNNEGDSVY
jgi:hypothetical protein